MEFNGKKPKATRHNIQIWQAPQQEFTRINFDAPFSEEKGSDGWGCIATNSDGEILFAAAWNIDWVSATTHAEAMALIQSIKVAEGLEVGCVVSKLSI